MMRVRPRRLMPALALLLALALLTAGPDGRAAAAAQTDEAPGLAVIRATYTILLDQFYRPTEPDELLYAAWDGVAAGAGQLGLRRPAPLPTLARERDAAFEQFAAAYSAYLERLGRDVPGAGLGFAAASAMARSLNEGHTAFLPPASYRAFLGSLGGSDVPVGVGVRRTSRPPWVITDVAPDGPAERAGIIPGDVIVTVDGRDVRRLSNAAFAQALAGDEGADVTLGIDRGDDALEFTVTRGRFYFPPLRSRMLADGVGYLRLESFVQAGIQLPNGTELLSDLDRRLDELDAQGARALILDLRGNPGGDVFTTSEILGRFLPEDTLSVVRSDQRGHISRGIVGGLMRRAQHPLVVLVDGGSASSSEVTASTLKESGRALLVGQRTAGVLATSQVLPLPEDAGLQVAVAEQETAVTGFRIDEVGFPVDISVRDTRTAADYLGGRDPQLEAAVAALAQAPPPPAFDSTVSPLSAAEIRMLLAPYVPGVGQIPTNDRLTRVTGAESWTFTHPNQLMNFNAIGARDPLALQETIRSRGWLGTYERGFSRAAFTPPSISVTIDLYATAEGAMEALATNDYPDVQVAIPPLVDPGEQSTSYRGIWIANGALATSWRRGRVVFTVSYGDVPGFERTDVLVETARLVDSLYQQNPLPATAPRRASAAQR